MYIPAWPSLSPADFIQSENRGAQPFPLNAVRSTYFYVARNGIYHLFRSLRLKPGDVVLVPDYHHGNEIDAMRAAGVTLKYYPVQYDFTLDLDAVSRLCKAGARALYVTHFVGWPQPMDEIRALCTAHDVTLIEDCALSFMSAYKGTPLGKFGDYSVFCLYKTVPVPNGGVLVQNDSVIDDLPEIPLADCRSLSVAARSSELLLQWLRLRNETLGSALFALKRRAGKGLTAANISRTPVGDTSFNPRAANLSISKLSRRLLPRFDYQRIRQARRQNFQFLQDRLQGSARLLPIALSEDVCPLFFPLLVKDKKAAAAALWKNGIQAVQFWNTGDPEAQRDGYPAEFLRRHVLEVPIHQDATLERLDLAAKHILNLDLYL
jgi:perosamine synthetase